MQRIFFIGIKGAGMSALARVLQAQGNSVSGSDITDYVFTQDGLAEDNIAIFPFQVENFSQKYDVIIRGNAFNKDNNIEIAYLEEQGIASISYYDFLNQFLSTYTSFAITGTHGKTTTTGLVAKVFEDDNYAYLIGDGTGDSKPNADLFVFESCEYKRHFLAYHPDYSVITNIEYDHPDYFSDLADVIAAFSSMVRQTKEKVIVFGDDAAIQEVIALNERSKFITYGFNPDNDYHVRDYTASAEGFSFSLWQHDEKIYAFELPFFGTHMLLNAIPAIIIGLLEGKTPEAIEQKLKTYEGVKRRFNVETLNQQIIIDDYAHHPTEIAVTLEAVKQKFPGKQIVTIFQPHTFTRTEALAQEFITALVKTDILYITDIFASAREAGNETTPTVLLKEMPKAYHLTRENIKDLLGYDNSVLVFMGAGDIQKYLEALKNMA